jgi:catechol 2,3-dioxygenase-like lactoylglutathione lyase family enzyme
MAEPPTPAEGIALTHFIVSEDVERSRRFYTEVLGGETVRSGEPSVVALANSWIIINVGGGPTDDKPMSRSRRRATQIGRAAFSISGSRTSELCMPNGAPAGPSF